MSSTRFSLNLDDLMSALPSSVSPLVEQIESTPSVLTNEQLAELAQALDPATLASSALPAVPHDFTGYLDLANTRYKPRDYQLEGVKFLLDRKRAFLTDKPGLGKTLQAALAAKPPVLIFAPTYLTYNWYNFLKEVIPASATLKLVSGSKLQRLTALVDNPTDWTICNVEMLRDYKFEQEYHTLIIDEAHHLRGRNSQQTLGALDLGQRVENVYLLTATPILNRPDDLYSQLRMIDPKNFSSYWQFINAHCKVVQEPFGPKVLGARPSLKPTFERYNLGRTYSDVEMELPDLVSDVITIEPPDDFKKLYRNLRDSYYVPGRELYENALEVLQALRKLTAPQKLKPLLSLLTDTDALAGTVIFSWYKETARNIAELLEIPCVTGDMSPKERLAVAKSAPCISATISSMSEGVDLSHLHTIVFFELDYVPGTLYQALSRVRRHGGDHKVVNAYYLVVKNTIDEILYKLDDSRKRTINSIVREALE